jgi:hypothetical protein
LALTGGLVWSIAGCATATVSVRQPDGTYRTTNELVWWSPDDVRSFECQDDYMVATEMWDVTYELPKGTGHFPNLETMTFEGQGIDCEVQLSDRTLTLNGEHYGPFDPGDRVRITPDAQVLTNGFDTPARADDTTIGAG